MPLRHALNLVNSLLWRRGFDTIRGGVFKNPSSAGEGSSKLPFQNHQNAMKTIVSNTSKSLVPMRKTLLWRGGVFENPPSGGEGILENPSPGNACFPFRWKRRFENPSSAHFQTISSGHCQSPSPRLCQNPSPRFYQIRTFWGWFGGPRRESVGWPLGQNTTCF